LPATTGSSGRSSPTFRALSYQLSVLSQFFLRTVMRRGTFSGSRRHTDGKLCLVRSIPGQLKRRSSAPNTRSIQNSSVTGDLRRSNIGKPGARSWSWRIKLSSTLIGPEQRWFGRVAQANAAQYYRDADIFILPTLSDGFALTQLEAQAHGLPVIASRRCGEMVRDSINGIVLEESTPDAIVEALQFCLRNPDQLAQFSENATIGERFSLSCLGATLCALAA